MAEPETHAQRVERELEEQKVMLRKAKEDSDRYDAAMAALKSEAEGQESLSLDPPEKPASKPAANSKEK